MLLLWLVIVIFVHHAGHWVVAKAFGLSVNPSPVGCCTPRDEAGFSKVAAGKRLLLASSGLLASYLFAVVPLTLMLSRESMVSSLTVESAPPEFPAAEAGVQPGDTVVGLDGAAVASFDALREAVAKNPATMRLEIERGDQRLQLDVKLRPGPTGQPVLGIVPRRVPHQPTLAEAFAAAHRLPWQPLKRILFGDVAFAPVGGPVQLYLVPGTPGATSAWFTTFFGIAVTVSLWSMIIWGVHLLPLPGLDGWLLLMGLRELVTRKAPDYAFHARARAKALWVILGFGALLFLLVLKNDVSRLLR